MLSKTKYYNWHKTLLFDVNVILAPHGTGKLFEQTRYELIKALHSNNKGVKMKQIAKRNKNG